MFPKCSKQLVLRKNTVKIKFFSGVEITCQLRPDAVVMGFILGVLLSSLFTVTTLRLHQQQHSLEQEHF